MSHRSRAANHICVRADGGLLIVYRTHIDLNNFACVNPRIHHAAAAGLSSGFWQRLQYSSGGVSTRSPVAVVAAVAASAAAASVVH